jgi:hypothetical protein
MMKRDDAEDLLIDFAEILKDIGWKLHESIDCRNKDNNVEYFALEHKIKELKDRAEQIRLKLLIELIS